VACTARKRAVVVKLSGTSARMKKSSPPLLVVEAEDGTVLDLSLTELKDGGHRLSDVAWKDLLEGYQLFTCRATPPA
jgi:hypothetical protein